MVRVGKYDSFTEYIQTYRVQDWLRLVIIIGGYLLLRPILIRYGARLQEKHLEKEDATVSKEGLIKEKKQNKKARSDLQWGTNARIRQRKTVERLMQGGEESDSDDLQDLLE